MTIPPYHHTSSFSSPLSTGLSSSTSNLLAISKQPTANNHVVNRSVSFTNTLERNKKASSSNIGRSPSHCSALRRYLADQHLASAGNSPLAMGQQPKSSVQRLIDTFENENRRHFDEFQRINDELRVGWFVFHCKLDRQNLALIWKYFEWINWQFVSDTLLIIFVKINFKFLLLAVRFAINLCIYCFLKFLPN